MSGLPSLQTLLFSDSPVDGGLGGAWDGAVDWQTALEPLQPLHYPPPPAPAYLPQSPPSSSTTSSSSSLPEPLPHHLPPLPGPSAPPHHLQHPPPPHLPQQHQHHLPHQQPSKTPSEKASPDSSSGSGSGLGAGSGTGEGGPKKSASDRERSRMKDMNLAFDKLRCRLGHMKQQGKRLSKIQALRSAIQYIEDLEHVLLYADCQPPQAQYWQGGQAYFDGPYGKADAAWPPPNPPHTPPPSDFSPFHALNHP